MPFEGRSYLDRGALKIIQGASSIADLLKEQPPLIDRIIDVNPDEILVLSPQELEDYIFDELLQRTRGSRDITPDYIMALRYIAEVISNIRTPMESDMYGFGIAKGMYTLDGAESGDFQTAGDSAVFGHIHFAGKRNNALSKKDYANMAEIYYRRWYETRPQSIAQSVAINVRGILAKMENWSTDMMKRVPALSVVPGRI